MHSVELSFEFYPICINEFVTYECFSKFRFVYFRYIDDAFHTILKLVSSYPCWRKNVLMRLIADQYPMVAMGYGTKYAH